MNFKDVAHGIVEQQNNEKWHEQRDRIEKALMSAYQVGFLDGEASARPVLVGVRSDGNGGVVAAYDTDGGAAVEGCAV